MSTLGTKIVIDGDSTGFERAAGRVGKTMKGLTGKISGDLKSLAAGYVSIQAFKSLILDVGKAALAIDDFSDRQNTTIEETQRLIQAFKMFGLEAGDAETALMKLASTRKSAAETDSGMLAMFNKYGVSMDDLNNGSLTNFDLMKKIGVAMKDMKVNPAMMTDMKELFGKSGGKLIQGLKELGEGRAISMIKSEDVEAASRMEKAFESMRNSWNSIASQPLSEIANLISYGLKKTDPKDKKMLALAKKESQTGPGGVLDIIHPASIFIKTERQKEFKDAANLLKQALGGGDPYELEFARRRLANLLEEKTGAKNLHTPELDIFAAAQAEDKAAEDASKPDGKPLFVDQRPIKLAKEQANLDKVIQNALVGQLDPLDQNIAKRKEIFDLINESRELLYKNTEEGNVEAIRLQKEAVGIAAGLDSEKTPGIGAIPLDSAAKANLGVGVQAYDPMIYNTQQNTSALKELTQTIKDMRESAPLFGPDTATVFE